MNAKKRTMIILLPSAIILLLGVAVIIGYSWYVKVKRIGTIDAETKDVSFAYYFDNNSSNVNEASYMVKNLTFFDIDSTSEVSYLNSSLLKVEIHLENTTKYNLSYTINFSNQHNITSTLYTGASYDSSLTYYEDEACQTVATDAQTSFATRYVKTSDSYCDGILSTNSALAPITTETKINELTTVHSISGTLKAKGATGNEDKTTIYLYLFGIQLIDSASNDFMNTPVRFQLNFSAQNTDNYDAQEVTTSKAES